MGTTTAKLSFEDFQRLQDAAEETVRYELDEGELIFTPSPTYRHNLVSFRLRRVLAAFVEAHQLGVVTGEVDFLLAANTVRKPDIAFIARDQMKGFDPDRSPIECPPSLAVEVISPSNLAQDTLKKVHQYLAAGSHAVWLIYPPLKVIEIHDRDGIRGVTEQDPFLETQLFPGLEFSLSLTALFDDNPER
jgi:Uma2 family endonuclease